MEHRCRYAQVALPLPIERPLTYLIPPSLRDLAEAGKRALVPLGKRLLTGYIVGLSEETALPRVKEVQEIFDPEPLLDQHLLDLTRWVADSYLCPLGLCIRAALPPGIDASTNRVLVLTASSDALSEEKLQKLPPLAREVVASLQREGSLPLSRLKRRHGAREAGLVVRNLEQQGIARLESSLARPKVGPKQDRFVRLTIDGQMLEEALKLIEKKATKQARLLKRLLQGPLRVAEAKAVGGPSSIKSLLAKGLISIFEKEVHRDPFRGPMLDVEVPPVLTPAQEAALKTIQEGINRGGFFPTLLFGITGSGKTEVYLRAIQAVLEKGGQALVLVPEIALTPLAVARFRARFGEKVATLHSGLRYGERFDQWMQARKGKVSIVVGARSAVFAPLPSLGIIVVDEEHDPSYKQEEEPRYHARDVALMRAKMLGIPLLLGSATPSFESFFLAESGRYQLIRLPERVEARSLPQVRLVDMRKEGGGRMPIFSQELLGRVEAKLHRGEQVLLFLNRRGYATFVLCRECGLALDCPHCSTSLVYHAQDKRLRCHSCGFQQRPPALCPRCGGFRLGYLGFGTQQVEEVLRKRFPHARVARMDRDAVKGGEAYQRLLKSVEQGKVDILVGTQMIGKGHDFPGITLAGAISADLSLQLPDFRAAERTFALLTQLAGRAGRGDAVGEALIQTYNPDHYCLLAACRQEYESLYRAELPLRAERRLPPFARLIRVVISSLTEAEAKEAASVLAGLFRRQGGPFALEGPAPALLSKIRGRFRWQLLIKGEGAPLLQLVASALRAFARSASRARVEVDVDPLDLS